MAETDDILASTRLALRRESPRWSKGGSGETGAAVDPLETAPLVNWAAQLQDTSRLLGPHRLRFAKRVLLRLAAFYTVRQARFNMTVVQVLKGNQRVLDALWRDRHRMEAKLADQEQIIASLRREVDRLARTSRSG
jgi:hypothetical protein